MLTLNPSEVYRRSLEDDNQRQREENAKLLENIERLQAEAKDLHEQLYKWKEGGWD